jgi:hypothetical protein
MKTFTKTVQGVTFQGRDYEVKPIKVESCNILFAMDHVGNCEALRPIHGYAASVHKDKDGRLLAMAVGPKSEYPNFFWRLDAL